MQHWYDRAVETWASTATFMASNIASNDNEVLAGAEPGRDPEAVAMDTTTDELVDDGEDIVLLFTDPTRFT